MNNRHILGYVMVKTIPATTAPTEMATAARNSNGNRCRSHAAKSPRNAHQAATAAARYAGSHPSLPATAYPTPARAPHSTANATAATNACAMIGSAGSPSGAPAAHCRARQHSRELPRAQPSRACTPVAKRGAPPSNSQRGRCPAAGRQPLRPRCGSRIRGKRSSPTRSSATRSSPTLLPSRPHPLPGRPS
jgi:hypothetical protein